MDICIVTGDDILARFLILEFFEAGFSAEQGSLPSENARLNICDLDFLAGEIPDGSIGFSYSDANAKRVCSFLPRPISASTLLSAVNERLLPVADKEVRGITVDKASRKAKTDIGEVRLSEKELALLILLCGTKMLSYDRASTVFGDGESNIINVYMHYLRKKLKKICPYDVIESKRAEGFSLIYPVEIN